MALPEPLKEDVERWRADDYGNYMGNPPMRLAEWSFAGNDATAGEKAMLDVRAALGNAALGNAQFVQYLAAAQQVTMRSAYPNVNENAHAAFAKAIADGSIGVGDVKALVDGQSGGGHHETIGRENIEFSSYVDHLGHDDKSNAFRTAFARECVEKATALTASSPTVSAELYAEAANAMADMPPAQVKAELAEISRKGGDQALAHFAAGAMAGIAERAKPEEVPTGRYEFRADGLATVMQKLNSQIQQGQQSGKRDAAAESMGGQLFTGVTTYLTDARGTPQDRALGDNDERTGLRHAMNETVRTNFESVFRQNAMKDGEGLTFPNGGFDTVSSYARFEFGAKDDAHGRATSDEASRVVGQKLGMLEADLIKAARDGGADLRRDFGAGTFGNRENEQPNVALTIGQMIGATRNGINQDFYVRADHSKSDQAEMKDGFEFEANVMKYAGKVAGEEVKPFFETGEKIFDALKDATPENITGDSGQDKRFKQLEGAFAEALATYRPDKHFVKTLEDGAAHANTEWTDYKENRMHNDINDQERATQKGFLSKLMTKELIPRPDDPAKPLPHQEMSKSEVERKTAEAVEQYNERHKPALPKPARVDEWNGTDHKGGVVLKIGDDDYVISTGRGSYKHFDTEQTRGVHPVSEKPADLYKDGTIHQNVRGTEALAR